MSDLIDKLYHNSFLERFFHTSVYCLESELKDCRSVLDIGCGPSSPLQYCKNIECSVGVEPFGPYLEKSRTKKIHTEYFDKKIEELDFDENSFDAVIMIEVLEHLEKDDGRLLLKKAEKWAKKKVIISTPNGYLPEKSVDGNSLQKHLSGWGLRDLRSLGYRCSGLAGLKILRQENQEGSMAEGSLLSSIRFRPRLFWFMAATLSQLVTYRFPKLAFGLFCVKETIKDHDDIYSDQYYGKMEYGFRDENRPDQQRLLKLLRIKNTDRVLDIGCGFGVLLNKIPSGNKVGIESNKTAVSECLKKGLNVVCGDVEEGIPFGDGSFDTVIMNEVIEHLREPGRVVRECCRILGSGEILALTTPNRNIFLKVYKEPTHFSEMNIRELRDLLARNGFTIINHEVSGWSFLFPILEWFVFLPGRTVKKVFSSRGGRAVDKTHKMADGSLLKPFAAFRDWGLRWGMQQLVIARKR